MLDLIAFAIFILVIVILVYRDRKNVKRQGIMIMRRSKKGRDTIDKIAKKHPRFWKGVGNFGIIVAICVMIIATAIMIKLALDLILTGARAGGLALLLPGPVATAIAIPGVFVVPWWIWVIGIAIIIIPHELFHGIMCRLDKIRIKSVGWVLLLFLPGAFVEPDEKQLQKAKRITKIRVYAAGSFINIMIGLLLLAILSIFIFFSGPQVHPVGLAYQKINGTPAYLANLSGPIISINSISVTNPEEMQSVLSKLKPGDRANVTTMDSKPAPIFNGKLEYIFPQAVYLISEGSTKTTEVTLAENPDKKGIGYLGIYYSATVYDADNDLNIQLIQVIIWIYVFCIGIGLVNLLPIKPLDGGLIFEEIVDKYVKKRKKIIVRAMSIFILLLIIFNLVFPIVRNLIGF